MNPTLLALISERTSPLFRIMWVTNAAEPARRFFDNNVSAFHIGSGYFLSVAHNLRTECPVLKSIPEKEFENGILTRLNPAQRDFIDRCYESDARTSMRHLKPMPPGSVQAIPEVFQAAQFDTRWIELAEKKISVPHAIIQFHEPKFYDVSDPGRLFGPHLFFHEPSLDRYTFLIPLVLEKAWYSSDIALYRADLSALAGQEITRLIPSVSVDLTLLPEDTRSLYCLQSSPAGVIGRLLNTANLEGYLDHYQTFNDRIGGNYILEGIRYLIRGYFRFGSSGAPYLILSDDGTSCMVNAIQSEASPVQLSINNNREGNYQYVNAIASPLHIVARELSELTGIVSS